MGLHSNRESEAWAMNDPKKEGTGMNIAAVEIKGMFQAFLDCIRKNKTYLIELDSLAGDGDLGLSMTDGFTAVASAFGQSDETDIGKLLFLAGKTFNNFAPSTAGTLLSNGFIQSAKALRATREIQTVGIALMMRSWLDGIMKMGEAGRGEKTLVDALAPAVDILEAEAGNPDLKAVLAKAAAAAADGAGQTVGMVAKHGRAAIRGSESIGMLDPGAAMVSLLIQAMSQYVSGLPDS
jgi:phosphoenolpyruvate---glycerone phosphotransferase subunit DhaL